MELLFKNTTKFSENIYTDFLLFHNKTYRFSYYLYTIGISFLLLFCIAGHIAYQNYFLLVVFLLLLFIFLYWRTSHPTKTIKKEYEGEKITKQQEITYLFYPNYFEVHYQDSINVMYYRNIYRVFETDAFFYLYLDKTHAFLIDKETFSIR